MIDLDSIPRCSTPATPGWGRACRAAAGFASPGWSPKYLPPVLVQYAHMLLRDKVLFGSDFPVLTQVARGPSTDAARLLGLVA